MEEGGSFGRRAKRSLSSSSLSSSLSRAFLNVGGPAAVIALSLSLILLCRYVFFFFGIRQGNYIFEGGAGGEAAAGSAEAAPFFPPLVFFFSPSVLSPQC